MAMGSILQRLESLAEAGGICISGTVYDQIATKLALRYEFLGEHTVRTHFEPGAGVSRAGTRVRTPGTPTASAEPAWFRALATNGRGVNGLAYPWGWGSQLASLPPSVNANDSCPHPEDRHAGFARQAIHCRIAVCQHE